MSDLAIDGVPELSAEWIDQTAQAFAKVAANRGRLSKIAKGHGLCAS